MSTFNCLLHGEYTDDGYPRNYEGNWTCTPCARARDKAIEAEGADYRRAYAWRHRWRRDSHVPTRGRNRTLANWKPSGRAQVGAGKLVQGWCADIPGHVIAGNGLTLLGPPGVGKTHLGYGIVAEAYKAGIFARYAVWGDVLDRHKATFGNRNSEDSTLLGHLKASRLLVLDEIGVRAGSEFDSTLLFDLIDARYRDQLVTVVASNLTTETLDTIGERTADRLREMNLVVMIPGASQRATAAVNRDLLNAPPALIEPQPPVIDFEMCVNGEMVTRPLKIEPPEVWA